MSHSDEDLELSNAGVHIGGCLRMVHGVAAAVLKVVQLIHNVIDEDVYLHRTVGLSRGSVHQLLCSSQHLSK